MSLWAPGSTSSHFAPPDWRHYICQKDVSSEKRRFFKGNSGSVELCDRWGRETACPTPDGGIGPPAGSCPGAGSPGDGSAVAETDLAGERRAEALGGQRTGVVGAGGEDDAHAPDGTGIGRLPPVAVEVLEDERPHAVDHRLRAGPGVAAQDVAIQLPGDALAGAGDHAVVIAIDVEHEARGLDDGQRRLRRAPLAGAAQLAREPRQGGAGALLRLDARGADGPRLVTLLERDEHGADDESDQRQGDENVGECHARSVQPRACTRQRPIIRTPSGGDVRRPPPGSREDGRAADRPWSRPSSFRSSRSAPRSASPA